MDLIFGLFPFFYNEVKKLRLNIGQGLFSETLLSRIKK